MRAVDFSAKQPDNSGRECAERARAAWRLFSPHRRAATLRSCAGRYENSNASADGGLSLIWPRRRRSPRRPLFLVGSWDSDRGLALRCRICRLAGSYPDARGSVDSWLPRFPLAALPTLRIFEGLLDTRVTRCSAPGCGHGGRPKCSHCKDSQNKSDVVTAHEKGMSRRFYFAGTLQRGSQHV